MSKRFQLPSGKYTEKRHTVFGTGRVAGLDLWVLLSHSSNAKPVQRVGRNGEPTRVVELRLCVQNFDNIQTLVQISSTRIVSHGENKRSTVAGASSLGIQEVALIAMNGQQVPRETVGNGGREFIELRTNDFCVFSCAVHCPSDILYETDLLARIAELSLECHVPTGPRGVECHVSAGPRGVEFPTCPQRHGSQAMALILLKRFFQPVKLAASVIEEKYIWECYDQLPGGVVLFTGDDGLRG